MNCSFWNGVYVPVAGPMTLGTCLELLEREVGVVGNPVRGFLADQDARAFVLPLTMSGMAPASATAGR